MQRDKEGSGKHVAGTKIIASFDKTRHVGLRDRSSVGRGQINGRWARSGGHRDIRFTAASEGEQRVAAPTLVLGNHGRAKALREQV